jgi:hypothetical protein
MGLGLLRSDRSDVIGARNGHAITAGPLGAVERMVRRLDQNDRPG